MRFNDKEIQKVGETPNPTLEGVLHHLKPQGNDWSDWVAQQSFKQRRFKLVANILYYYRINEEEPLGILILENGEVAYERQQPISFAFSITFRDSAEKQFNPDRKHIFSCRTEPELNKWVSTLKQASYEHWRSQLTILRTKIKMRTGSDPLEKYFNNGGYQKQNISLQSSSKPKVVGQKKSTFHSHLNNDIYINHSDDYCFQPSEKRESLIPTANLIDL